jgi:hypothetical protein
VCFQLPSAPCSTTIAAAMMATIIIIIWTISPRFSAASSATAGSKHQRRKKDTAAAAAAAAFVFGLVGEKTLPNLFSTVSGIGFIVSAVRLLTFLVRILAAVFPLAYRRGCGRGTRRRRRRRSRRSGLLNGCSHRSFALSQSEFA